MSSGNKNDNLHTRSHSQVTGLVVTKRFHYQENCPKHINDSDQEDLYPDCPDMIRTNVSAIVIVWNKESYLNVG